MELSKTPIWIKNMEMARRQRGTESRDGPVKAKISAATPMRPTCGAYDGVGMVGRLPSAHAGGRAARSGCPQRGGKFELSLTHFAKPAVIFKSVDDGSRQAFAVMAYGHEFRHYGFAGNNVYERKIFRAD